MNSYFLWEVKIHPQLLQKMYFLVTPFLPVDSLQSGKIYTLGKKNVCWGISLGENWIRALKVKTEPETLLPLSCVRIWLASRTYQSWFGPKCHFHVIMRLHWLRKHWHSPILAQWIVTGECPLRKSRIQVWKTFKKKMGDLSFGNYILNAGLVMEVELLVKPLNTNCKEVISHFGLWKKDISCPSWGKVHKDAFCKICLLWTSLRFFLFMSWTVIADSSDGELFFFRITDRIAVVFFMEVCEKRAKPEVSVCGVPECWTTAETPKAKRVRRKLPFEYILVSV